ncbi:type 1 glutamine amidotransferase domain-containing protein [Roseomonas indoligenes]|uniref:Type 1 glutamine amidotransferase domain-containing protein n=1 Tax=Roseomonas indoligenes TaxID=2820811 RepID=A0A940N1D8_9PROT|nr:type 1 glutamine amidotransferase domain-containing protein [Pararoseomonas indoligenes]MBP0494251.1 type 1 glutamine amidotransferase domain-containing protein [Pararoseomonas indoligenes]
MTKGTVLVAGSNATRIELRGGGTAAIGQYLNETVVPAMALIKAGYDVVLATPDGTRPHIDEASDSVQHFGGDEAAYARARRFYADDPSMNEVRRLRSVVEDGLDRFAGLFVPGGHAPVVDLMQDADLGTILRHFHEAGKPTALLCHGPVAIVAAMPRAREFRAALIAGDEAGAAEYARGWAYAGYRMTVFSASEERIAEDALLHGKLYFDMPEALQAAGGRVGVNPVDFAPNVVVDRELITGQNPSSDHQLAARLIEALDHALAEA